MAIIQLGPLVAGIRGKLAGIIFTANKSGPYVRGWGRGANPRTPLQTAQRGRVSEMPTLWQALTGPQQIAWDTFAALPAQEQFNSLGDSYFLSGWQWFSKCNTRLLVMGRATISATPVIARPSAPTITNIQIRSTGHVNGDVLNYPVNEFLTFDLVLQVAIVFSTGIQVKTNNFKGILDTQAPGASQQHFEDEVDARFGTIQIGQKGFTLTHRQTTEGLRSTGTAKDNNVFA